MRLHLTTEDWTKQLTVRIITLISGLILISLGVAVFSKASLGFDPFMIFDSGIAKTFGLSLGVMHVIINLFLLVIYLLIRKKQYINVGTLLALTVTGPCTDLLKVLNDNDAVERVYNIVVEQGEY